MNQPKLSRRRQRQLRDHQKQKSLPGPRLQPHELTADQRKLLVFLNICTEGGNPAPTTKDVAEGCQWDLRHAVDVLRQARALGFIHHDMDGPGRQPEPVLLEVLRRYNLQSALDGASRSELDALVLIEQGADRLPASERAGFLIGCGLQELREQGHTTEEIRKLVLDFLDTGDREWAEEQKTPGAPN